MTAAVEVAEPVRPVSSVIRKASARQPASRIVRVDPVVIMVVAVPVEPVRQIMFAEMAFVNWLARAIAKAKSVVAMVALAIAEPARISIAVTTDSAY